MKDKGFTLIELLAVLTILAIIALIVIPIVSGIIKDSRIESRKRSIDMYGRAIEQAIRNEAMKKANDDLTCSDYENIINNLEYNGSKVECNITINDDETVYLKDCKVKDKEVDYEYGKLKTSMCNINNFVGDSEDTFTGNIYRNSNEAIAIGQSIKPHEEEAWCGLISEQETSCNYGYSWNSETECISGMNDLTGESATCQVSTITKGLTEYYKENEKDNIEDAIYIKHKVENDIVTETYLCLKYEENNKVNEACMRGGDSSYFGTFTKNDETNEIIPLNGNIKTVYDTRNYFNSLHSDNCIFSEEEFYCGTYGYPNSIGFGTSMDEDMFLIGRLPGNITCIVNSLYSVCN